jgi:HrpA-like RNA helicase
MLEVAFSMTTSMEHWWKETNKNKQEYCEHNPSQAHCGCHKHHNELPAPVNRVARHKTSVPTVQSLVRLHYRDQPVNRMLDNKLLAKEAVNIVIIMLYSQLVEALFYKSGGRGFDSRWRHWNLSLT